MSDTIIEFKKRPSKGPDGPNVQDVINALMKIEDKTLPVFGYLADANGDTYDIIKLDCIDLDISDRIDINLVLSE